MGRLTLLFVKPQYVTVGVCEILSFGCSYLFTVRGVCDE